MARALKTKSRKPRPSDAHRRALMELQRIQMRRYLSFVRAIVGVTRKAAAR
jgi:hypothetical protein